MPRRAVALSFAPDDPRLPRILERFHQQVIIPDNPGGLLGVDRRADR